jgi:hypothetical protein
MDPNPSPFSELIDDESKKRVIDSYIVFYKNPKFEDFWSENGENTRLRRTDR